MTIQALAVLRPLCGIQSIHIDVGVVDSPTRRMDRQTVEFTIYVAGSFGESSWAHESAGTLEDAVNMAVAKLRPAADDQVGLAEAAIAGLTDPRR